MRRRWHRSSIHFVDSTNNTFWRAWCYQQWPIASTNPKDERGRDRELERNYLDDYHVPTEYHSEGMAVQYVEVLRMSYVDILDMDYADFTRVSLLHKAVTMRRPARFITEHEHILQNTRRKYGI